MINIKSLVGSLSDSIDSKFWNSIDWVCKESPSVSYEAYMFKGYILGNCLLTPQNHSMLATQIYRPPLTCPAAWRGMQLYTKFPIFLADLHIKQEQTYFLFIAKLVRKGKVLPHEIIYDTDRYSRVNCLVGGRWRLYTTSQLKYCIPQKWYLTCRIVQYSPRKWAHWDGAIVPTDNMSKFCNEQRCLLYSRQPGFDELLGLGNRNAGE